MDIKKYLIDRKEEIEALKVIERNYEINANVHFINAIVGARRVGKTYFLYEFIKKNKLKKDEFAFVNFEEVKLDPLKVPFLHQEIYSKEPKYLFFDEIQNVTNWERVIYSLFEKKKYIIFITGSSSKLLSKEIATALRGRTKTINIYPFSFKEVLKLKLNNFNINQLSSYYEAKIKALLNKHLKIGFFPDIVLENASFSEFFSNYLDLIIYKDIEERYNIRNRLALEFFIKATISSYTKQFSVHKVYKMLKAQDINASKMLLYRFMNYISDVGIIFFLKKFSYKQKQVFLSIPKTYTLDPGLFFFVERRDDYGKLMEGIVFSELVKKHNLNYELFYYKTNENYEVDFVVKEGLKVKQLIQVTDASSKEEIKKRELRALLKASKELHCNDLLVITWDYESEEDGIKFVPLWKWLLQ